MLSQFSTANDDPGFADQSILIHRGFGSHTEMFELHLGLFIVKSTHLDDDDAATPHSFL